MEGRQIRERFLRFFEERGHRRVPSSSLIPPQESGLLLTNAGMNQFIPYFLGHTQPPFPRATSVQKCFPAVGIVRRGKEDNYWWTHAAGPAGPCSEIYVDRGPKYGAEGGPAVDEERFLEIWNHVFMQEEVDDQCRLVGELPEKNIDTGSSVERVATVLQAVDNIFETDLLHPLLEVAESLSGKRHGEDP